MTSVLINSYKKASIQMCHIMQHHDGNRFDVIMVFIKRPRLPTKHMPSNTGFVTCSQKNKKIHMDIYPLMLSYSQYREEKQDTEVWSPFPSNSKSHT